MSPFFKKVCDAFRWAVNREIVQIYPDDFALNRSAQCVAQLFQTWRHGICRKQSAVMEGGRSIKCIFAQRVDWQRAYSLCSQLPVCKYVRDPKAVSIQSACSVAILVDCMHAFQCSDSCYTARVCMRSASNLDAEQTQETQGLCLNRSATDAGNWLARSNWCCICNCSWRFGGRIDSALLTHVGSTRATRPNPFAEPGLRRADRRGRKKKKARLHVEWFSMLSVR